MVVMNVVIFQKLDKDMANRVTCPTCRKVCELPGRAEGLPNNLHALHIVRLTNKKKNGQ